MLGSNDKRNFTRIGAECEMTFNRPDDSEQGIGKSVNLSAAGILFQTQTPLEPGISLEICVKPVNEITPPLHALIEVIRVVPVENGVFEIAGTIQGIKGV